MNLIGQILQGRYRISHLIGEGGMGRVYYAEDIRLNKVVAIKEILIPNNESSQLIEKRIRAFQREAQLLSGIIKHSAIPRVIDYFQVEENWYIVMDYIDGNSLERLLKKRGEPFPLEEVLLWTEQLLEILDSLHSETPPVIHRDIKPSNIKVKNGKVYLLDFGLAKQLSGSKSSYPLLTLAYASPEQMENKENKEPTAKSDLYSVGATMYCLLTNVEPASAFSRSLALASGDADPLPHIRELRTDLPDGIANLIMSALSIKPADRPNSAETMRMKLNSFLTERDKTPTMPSRDVSEASKTIPSSLPYFNAPIQPPPLTPTNRKRNGVKVAASLALLIAIGVIGYIMYPNNTPNRVNTPTPTPPVKSPRQIAAEKTVQAMEMLYINDYEKAKALSKEAHDSDPTYALAHAIHGDAFWDTDETEAGDSSKNLESQISKVEIFKIFSAQEPTTEEDFAARGWAFLDDNNWAGAKQDIEKVVAIRPEWAWALMVKASVAISTGCVEKNSREIRDGINALKKVNSLQPKYAMAYMNLAGAYQCNGQNQDALDAYGQAINFRPSSKFYVLRGNFYLDSIEEKTKQTTNIENAQKDFEEALKIQPEFSEAHIGLARVHEAREEYEDCIAEADKALSKAHSFEAYRHRTICRVNLASKEKDEKGFDEALESIENAKEQRNKYSDQKDQQIALANYYYDKAYIYNSKAFYFLTEKYLKNKTPGNKDKVNAELNDAQAAIKQAREINHDKDLDKELGKLEKQIEDNIRAFKRFLRRAG